MTDGTDGTGGTGGAGPCPTGGEPETSDSLKAFGEVVKAFRKRARLTQEQFAPKVRYSVPTVASIEQGRRFPPPDFVDRAEDVLDAFGAIRGAAKHLSRRPGLASWFRQWAKLEEEAISLYTYECRLVPGLVQTEPYARTVFVNQLPLLGDEKIEAQWAARAERQRLLRERPNTAYSFILEEQLLLRGMGGPEVTRGLIEHLLEIAELRNVELQIMPLLRENHAGLHGPMRLLETPQNKWLGYCEGQESGQFISDSKVVSTLHMRYARMRSQALTLEDSVGLLQRMRGAQ
ncbi:Scr1 family TA system antitoxin-like transcriptional regulator [Streptomyces sp. NPDC004609]|uniref:helix-turn-helix domain-containing protein n=1 Tax=Streptomyces sp. NPDC004609 TaxID=3364704 RepID=UPI00369D7125